MFGTLRNRVRSLLPHKLSAQLVALFMATFIFILTISFLLLYSDMADILSRSYENSSIKQFRQCDYNISNFCSSVDLISRQLVIDAQLQNLDDYATSSDSDRGYQASIAISHFNSIMSNYSYISSILYYTSEGLIIKCSAKVNDVLFDSASKNDWFYHSAPYLASKVSQRKIVWFGGYTSKDFSVDHNTTGDSAPLTVYYISASRNTLSGKVTGTLVINIDMKQFMSVYSNQSGDENGRMYIIDNEGRVISSSNTAMIGKKSDTFQRMDSGLSIENFTFDSKEGMIQAVYYRLKTPIGILINEVPVSVIMKDIMNLRNIVLLMFGLSLLLAFALFRFWLSRLMRPLKDLIGVIKGIRSGNLGLTIKNPPDNEIGTLINQFNKMSSSIEQLFHQNAETEAEKRSLEMEALRSQINPHFIYNTLNIIKWMAIIDRKNNIADCVTAFAEFLERILRKNDELCTVREEISHLDNYIKIINYRFGGGLELATDIPEDLLDNKILRFILQPIVENSVVHGLARQFGGVILVTMHRENGMIRISVADNGCGIEAERLREVEHMLRDGEPNRDGSIGLVNVNRRLMLRFGESGGIEIKNRESGGALTVFLMPFVR